MRTTTTTKAFFKIHLKHTPRPLRSDGLPDLAAAGNAAGSWDSPLRVKTFRCPRPHQTSSGQLSGSRCCVSRELAFESVFIFLFFSIQALVCVSVHACALFSLTEGQTRQIGLDTQGGPRDLNVRKGVWPAKQSDYPKTTGKTSGSWYVKKTKRIPEGSDWWPLCCPPEPGLAQKNHKACDCVYACPVCRAARWETKHCVWN